MAKYRKRKVKPYASRASFIRERLGLAKRPDARAYLYDNPIMKYEAVEIILYNKYDDLMDEAVINYIQMCANVGIHLREHKLDGLHYTNPMYALWVANIYMRYYKNTSYKFQLASKVYNYFLVRDPFLSSLAIKAIKDRRTDKDDEKDENE